MSPVIAVILMVAITVVMSATVYVWTSGFNQPHNGVAASISTAQRGTIGPSGTSATFTITSVSSGFQASFAKVLDVTKGSSFAFSAVAGNGLFTVQDDGGATALAGTAMTGAGDAIRLQFAVGGVAPGDTLQIVDSNSNSVLATMVAR